MRSVQCVDGIQAGVSEKNGGEMVLAGRKGEDRTSAEGIAQCRVLRTNLARLGSSCHPAVRRDGLEYGEYGLEEG